MAEARAEGARALIAILLMLRAASADDDCGYDLRPLWSAALKDSPLTATPLLFDVDGDGYDDVVAPSFSGDVWAVHGESGHIVDSWPFYLEDRGFHSTPIPYDVNSDGVLEFLLATIEAELVFVSTGGSLLHGETIKIPPLRLQRRWYSLGEEQLERLTESRTHQVNNDQQFRVHRNAAKTLLPPTVSTESETELPEFDNRYGRYSDPLYSRHHPHRLPSGLDPKDHEYVFVDAHILATPTLADLDEDGLWNELVVPVSYYFDPFHYGMAHNLKQLGGMTKTELVNFAAGGIVIVDLNTGKIIQQKVLGVTRASSDQPGYVLSSPTVVDLRPGPGGLGKVIIMATAAGEVHMLTTGGLHNAPSFPVLVDSVAAQVAVGELLGEGELQMVVGDDSGNVYCIGHDGKRLWEHEAEGSIASPAHFADFDGDGKLEVVLLTKRSSLVVLSGQTGTPLKGFPMHLMFPAMGGATALRLNRTDQEPALSILVPSINTLFAVEPLTGCLHTVQLDHVITGLLAADINPFSPGLELLATTFSGSLLCLSTATGVSGSHDLSVETWAGEGTGGSVFTHKSSSFALILPHSNHTMREVAGSSFTLRFKLVDGRQPAHQTRRYTVLVSVGRQHLLYSDVLHTTQRVTDISLSVPTPTSPIHAFLTLRVCNGHAQCETVTYITRFNLHFEDHLKWFLCLPFLSLVATLLWLLRDEGFQALPTTHRRQKDL